MTESQLPALSENGNGLAAFYERESVRIRRQFDATLDGAAVTVARAQLVDDMLGRLWQKYLDPALGGTPGLAMVALGGYGRGALFPFSDIDLLFLCESEVPQKELKDRIRSLCQDLWDARLKVSPSTRTIADCDRLHQDNVEFTVSLLDCRFLAGDISLFERLRNDVIPGLAIRESQTIIKRLTEVNDRRRAKYGNTIFHLEPNLKDGPGGLRDQHVAMWLSYVSGFAKTRAWVDPSYSFPALLREECAEATRFLSSVRCFLHYRQGRDENVLSWDAQDEAAQRGIGLNGAAKTAPAEWMRTFFRHARTISKLASQALEDVPSSRSSIYRQFQSWRGRVGNADFSVVNGRVYLQQPSALSDPDLLLRAFEFVAQHGTPLASATEQRIAHRLEVLAADGANIDWWKYLKTVLTRPRAALALRSMQQLGLLQMMVPEFHDIDCLVLRDLYHRYTVDEHSFLAVETLQKLHDPQSDLELNYGAILEELQHPERLMLAMLLHDIGKATSANNHVTASTELARPRLEALKLSADEIDDVCFLIQGHLDMSAALRRDIFDPASVVSFAQKVETPERLKMLCLLTYADIKAVNPEALTPWKAENLWHLFMGTSRALSRLIDHDRLHPNEDDEQLASIRALAPKLGKRLKNFLDGLPQRYLKVHSASEVLQHVEMASQLGSASVQTKLNRSGNLFELMLVTKDRPLIFANTVGTLSAWGMNIVRADAFSNSDGIVVDTFQFTDRFHTLELNLQEWDRFQASIADVLTGRVSLEKLAAGRRRGDAGEPKVLVPTNIEFDDECSEHSTLVEVVTQDRPGLLYRIAAQLAEHGCNIELALIDTEGQMAIDVFYLSRAGAKLTPEEQEKLRNGLHQELGAN
jgi:[protein-PII] uridylyltransferase